MASLGEQCTATGHVQDGKEDAFVTEWAEEIDLDTAYDSFFPSWRQPT